MSEGAHRKRGELRLPQEGVAVVAPLFDDDLCFPEAIEDLAVEQLIAQLCAEMLASRQAISVDLP